jgi:putative ABC transport system substrate-binding protein
LIFQFDILNQALAEGVEMKRRDLIAGSAATLFVVPGRALAQQTSKLPRIGVLVAASPPHPFADAFQRGLRSFGYTEGKNIVIQFLYTNARGDRTAELAAGLAHANVDIIVAHFTAATRAAMAATRTIPIVMAPAGAPLQLGFIASLARPGGNVTGLSAMDAELGGKQLQLLRELIPNLVCVGILGATRATDGGFGETMVAELHTAAPKASLRLVPALVDGPHEFDRAFETMSKAGAQAVITQELFGPHRLILIDLATTHQLALMAPRETTTAGGLVSMYPNYSFLYERAAFYVDKILKGAKPANLPVEQPTKFELVINMKTANVLGLTIPPVVLAIADEVID